MHHLCEIKIGQRKAEEKYAKIAQLCITQDNVHVSV